MNGQKITAAMVRGALVGFTLPIFWGVMGFLLFNLPEGKLARAFWVADHATVPLARFTHGSVGALIDPFANALLYALLFGVIASLYLASSAVSQ